MISGTSTSDAHRPGLLCGRQQLAEQAAEGGVGVGRDGVDVDAQSGERLDQTLVGGAPVQHHRP